MFLIRYTLQKFCGGRRGTQKMPLTKRKTKHVQTHSQDHDLDANIEFRCGECRRCQNTLLANETQNVTRPSTIVIHHFFARGKFMGFEGSLGPSHPTILVMGSTLGSVSCGFSCVGASLANAPFSSSTDRTFSKSGPYLVAHVLVVLERELLC
jgi:hypothetical protein